VKSLWTLKCWVEIVRRAISPAVRTAGNNQEKMTDLFERTQSEFIRHQSEFLELELAACSRAADIASAMRRGGDRRSAERTIAEAEGGYAALLRLVSDPQQARRLTIKAQHELTKKMKALRGRLDGLSSPSV
jgi:hypothetical protein